MNTIAFDTWRDFRDYIDRERPGCPVYWRGQRDPNWPLASSFERIILSMDGGSEPGATQVYPYGGRYRKNGRPTWPEGFYQQTRDRYLEVFKRSASGLRGANPKELTTDEWWALGRHYGLITPLLDWSEKPYVTAFFSGMDLFNLAGDVLASDVPLDARSVVDMPGQSATIYRLCHTERLEGDGLRVLRPELDELGRLHHQRGLFTWLDSETYFELQGFADDSGRDDLLTQITLSADVLPDGLRDLDAHGIDYRMLMPDLTGAALHANARADQRLLSLGLN